MQAIKSVNQEYAPTSELLEMLEAFRHMVNDCIRVGLENNVSTMKKLSLLSYGELGKYDIYSNYKLCAISKAAGILSTRKKSIQRGFKTKHPCVLKPLLVAYRGFKVESDKIRIPLGNRQYFDIPLNNYLRRPLLADPKINIRCFTLTKNRVIITYSKEIDEIKVTRSAGVDRNLRNLTYGNSEKVIQYDLSRAVAIAETTEDIVKSFKRNDVRILKKLAVKYGRRRKNRINQILHRVSKHIVHHAAKNKEAIAFEDIAKIR